MPTKFTTAITAALMLSGCSLATSHNTSDNSLSCASPSEQLKIEQYYHNKPTDPLPLSSRMLEINEGKVASALANSIGVVANPEILSQVWQTIDSWGGEQNVKFITTVNGWHGFTFKTKVPTTREKFNPGFYDIFADQGKGLHGHINPLQVKSIYATKFPMKDGKRNLAISLFDDKGDGIASLYATTTDSNSKLAQGFAKSWALIESLPRSCH